VTGAFQDPTVRLWDPDLGVELSTLSGRAAVQSIMHSPVLEALHSAVDPSNRLRRTCVAFSPDGLRIVSGSADKIIRVWDAQHGAELARLRGHESAINSVAYSPDGRWIVSGAWDDTVRIWDAIHGAEVACLREHERSVMSVAFSPDGLRIVSGSRDKTVRIWDSATGCVFRCLRGHESYVQSVQISPDGRRVVSGSSDGTVRVWETESGVCLNCFRGHADAIESVGFSPDGRWIASGSGDQTVRVWDAEHRGNVPHLCGHLRVVNELLYSPDGEQIASGSGCVYGFGDDTVRDRMHSPTARGQYTSGGTPLVQSRERAYWQGDNSLRVWDAASGVEIARLGWKDATGPQWRKLAADFAYLFGLHEGHKYDVTSVSFSPDGRRIISGSADRTVRLWCAERDLELACLRGHKEWVTSVALAADGQRIVSGSRDKTVRVWRCGRGKALLVLHGHTDWVVKVALSPDGQWIVSQSRDRTVRVWNIETGACQQIMEGLTDASGLAAALGTSSDGHALFAGEIESCVQNVSKQVSVGWFPATLRGIATAPVGSAWAGSIGSYVCVIGFEDAVARSCRR
jgi:WD40 repeat protein